MSAQPPSQVVVRRLRAHRLVPRTAPVRLVSGGSFAGSRGRLQWTAVHPVTGDSYRVASYYPLKQVVAARDWELVTDGDLILVVPRSMTLVPGGSHGS